MKIYMFKSGAKGELRAFAGDPAGSRLPDKFRPWHVVGTITPDRDPPYNMSRAVIEKAIGDEGFQLWRFKPKPQAASE
jgi:hypothetical protein